MRSHRALSRSLVVASALFAAAAHAQPARDPAAAEVLFREGRDAFKRGDWASACPKFAESQRLDPSAGTLFNLADCEEHAGKITSAWQHWQELAETLRATPGDERRAVAQKHASDLAPRLPRLKIVWSGGAPPNATVRRDGIELGPASLGEALPVEAGHHTIEVRVQGHAPKTFTASAREGAVVDVAISPGEATEAPVPGGTETKPPPPTEAKPPPTPTGPAPDGGAPVLREGTSTSSALTPVGWTLVALGSLVTVGGVAFGGGALAEKSTVDAECGAKVCTPAGVSAAQTGQTLATVSTVGFIVGPILLAGGVTFLILGGGSSKSSLSVSPRWGGAALEGRF